MQGRGQDDSQLFGPSCGRLSSSVEAAVRFRATGRDRISCAVCSHFAVVPLIFAGFARTFGCCWPISMGRCDVRSHFVGLTAQALNFATKLLEDAEAEVKPTGGKKKKAAAAASLAEALYDAREQIKQIVAAADPQAFVANGRKSPAVDTRAPSSPSESTGKPAATPIGSRVVIDAEYIKVLMARPSAPSRKAAIDALTRHKGDVRGRSAIETNRTARQGARRVLGLALAHAHHVDRSSLYIGSALRSSPQ